MQHMAYLSFTYLTLFSFQCIFTHLSTHTCSHTKTDSWSPTFCTFTQHHILFPSSFSLSLTELMISHINFVSVLCTHTIPSICLVSLTHMHTYNQAVLREWADSFPVWPWDPGWLIGEVAGWQKWVRNSKRGCILPRSCLDDIVKLAILWLMLPLCLQNITNCLGNAAVGSKKSCFCCLYWTENKEGF